MDNIVYCDKCRLMETACCRQLAAANAKLQEAARLAQDSAKQAGVLVEIPNRALEDIRDALNSPMEPSLSRMTHQQLIEEQARVLRLCSAIVDAYFASQPPPAAPGEKEEQHG